MDRRKLMVLAASAVAVGLLGLALNCQAQPGNTGDYFHRGMLEFCGFEKVNEVEEPDGWTTVF